MAEIISLENIIPDLNREQGLSLSQIESGCVIYEISEEICLILKDSCDRIRSLESLKGARLKFSPAMKLEFPNINMEMMLKTDNGLSVKYEYFFMTESEYDISLLDKIRQSGWLNIYLFDHESWFKFKFILNYKEIESVNTSFRDMNTVLTKNSL